MQNNEPDYLGVPKSAVIDSLERAEAFVRGLNLGPATAREMTDWLAGKPYDRIRAAQTRAELARAMAESGARSVFLRLTEIFAHYALADDQDAGPRRLYRDLARWGAFSDIRTASYHATDEEQDAHLVRCLAARTATPAGQARLERLSRDLAQMRQDHPAAYAREDGSSLSRMAGRVVDAVMHGGVSTLGAYFEKASLHERHLLKQVLKTAGGLEDRRNDIVVEGPFGVYGVVLPGAGAGQSFETMMQAAAPLRDAYQKALAPFYETGEVRMTAIGAITPDFNKCGLMFQASRAAAQAVADALSDQTVIDRQGRVIRPRPVPQP